jgi:hypothetical protein
VTAAVAVLVVADGVLAVATTGYDRNSTGILQQAPEPVGVIPFVGEQIEHATCAFEASFTSVTLLSVSISA